MLSSRHKLRNIRCTLAYVGTSYLGWQKTKEGPSIEGTLTKALETLLRHPIDLQAASRTDRGVHAREQVCHFFSSSSIDLSFLLYKLNRFLPRDISILSLEEASPTFHATLDARLKIYRYYICNLPFQLPFHSPFSWHVHHCLDLEKMNQGSLLFKGTHDFRSFTSKQSLLKEKETIRTIKEISIHSLPHHRICIEISGPKFLYKMVRTLVGNLVYLGMGKWTLEEMATILEKKDRRVAGITAPPHGLYLEKILYI